MGATADQLYASIDAVQQTLEGTADRYAAELAASFAQAEKKLIDAATPPAASASAVPATPVDQKKAEYRKLMVDKLITPVDFPTCRNTVSKTAIEIATAANNDKGASTETGKIEAKQKLAEAQLKAEGQRSRIVMFGNLAALDLKVANETYATAIAGSKSRVALSESAKSPSDANSKDSARCAKL